MIPSKHSLVLRTSLHCDFKLEITSELCVAISSSSYHHRGMIGTGKQVALDLCEFIDSSPSPFHAVNSASGRLLEAAFSEAE